MSSPTSDGVKGFVGVVLFFSMLLVPNVASDYYTQHFKTTCTTEAIPYESSSFDDDSLTVGTTSIMTAGVDGERTVCRRNGATTTNTASKLPVTQVIHVGTKPKPTPVYVAPATQRCEVTLCNDGTCSYSTGRGTCSWHGGVARYY